MGSDLGSPPPSSRLYFNGTGFQESYARVIGPTAVGAAATVYEFQIPIGADRINFKIQGPGACGAGGAKGGAGIITPGGHSGGGGGLTEGTFPCVAAFQGGTSTVSLAPGTWVRLTLGGIGTPGAAVSANSSPGTLATQGNAACKLEVLTGPGGGVATAGQFASAPVGVAATTALALGAQNPASGVTSSALCTSAGGAPQNVGFNGGNGVGYAPGSGGPGVGLTAANASTGSNVPGSSAAGGSAGRGGTGGTASTVGNAQDGLDAQCYGGGGGGGGAARDGVGNSGGGGKGGAAYALIEFKGVFN